MNEDKMKIQLAKIMTCETKDITIKNISPNMNGEYGIVTFKRNNSDFFSMLTRTGKPQNKRTYVDNQDY